MIETAPEPGDLEDDGDESQQRGHMFYEQPVAHRFGTVLSHELTAGGWSTFEGAVAWVRRSGTAHLIPALTAFLTAGGSARLTVGIDIENTSYEGLQDLLDAEAFGDLQTFVFHDEGSSTFHPKLYLFSNAGQARLIVGSNNLTEAGLFTNSEAGIRIDQTPQDSVILDAQAALEGWRDPSSDLCRRLDAPLLKELHRLNYVPKERSLQARRRASEGRRRSTTGQGLFGSRAYNAPVRPQAATPQAGHVAAPVLPLGGALAGTVLLMRVRRASARSRRNQIQIPFQVFGLPFFGGITALTSDHDGRDHQLSFAHARGNRNSIKVDLPEINAMNDPVVRLERTTQGVRYQAFDSNGALGRPIHQALLAGFNTNPAETHSTRAARATGTWWRFI